MAGMPPSTILNEQQTVGTGSTVTVLPNNQGTSLGGIKTRVETGNTNLLINPSFEHPTLGFGWTKTLGVWANDSTNVIDGKKAIQGAYSSGFDVSQISTVNAAKLAGVNMIALIYLYTDDASLQVCAVVNSVDTNCTIPGTSGTSVFKPVQIAFVGGATNNGIRIKTTNGVMADTHLDYAFVGLSNGFSTLNTGVEATTIQKFTSGSGTYTPTAGTLKIKVRMVGAGGGGNGGGSGSPGAGGTGGTTTFGTSLLTATGGSATGGIGTLNSPAIGTGNTGSLGQGSFNVYAATSVYGTGGVGGSSIFGGSGSGSDNSAGTSAIANSGSGGGGGGYGGSTGIAGKGGGAGGYVEAVIPSGSLLSSYSYAIGTGGTGGTAGTSGYTGGSGGSGYIEVTEYGAPTTVNAYIQPGSNARVAGEILPIAGAICPAGTLLANGSAISRTSYAQLFSAIGITHGQGDGSTTFNLPDYRGRFLRGVDGGAANDPDRASRTAMATGGNTGDAVGTLQADGIVSHNHTLITGGTYVGTYGNTLTNFSNSGSAGSIVTASTGGNETRPKNANVNYCILISNSSGIVASFSGVPTIPEAASPKIFGLVRNNTVCSTTPCTPDQIFNTSVLGPTYVRTALGVYTIALSGLTKTPACSVVIAPIVNQANKCQLQSGNTNSQIVVQCFTNATANVDEGFSLNCVGY